MQLLLGGSEEEGSADEDSEADSEEDEAESGEDEATAKRSSLFACFWRPCGTFLLGGAGPLMHDGSSPLP